MKKRLRPHIWRRGGRGESWWVCRLCGYGYWRRDHSRCNGAVLPLHFTMPPVAASDMAVVVGIRFAQDPQSCDTDLFFRYNPHAPIRCWGCLADYSAKRLRALEIPAVLTDSARFHVQWWSRDCMPPTVMGQLDVIVSERPDNPANYLDAKDKYRCFVDLASATAAP